MGRVMAFDYGLRWIGVAAGQALTGTGTPVARLPAREGVPDWNRIADLLAEWRPVRLLVGLPLNMDDSESEMSRRARKFGRRLEGRYGLPVEMVDERLSSYQAKQEAMARGGPRDWGREGIDDRAAVLILETWFSQCTTDTQPQGPGHDRPD